MISSLPDATDGAEKTLVTSFRAQQAFPLLPRRKIELARLSSSLVHSDLITSGSTIRLIPLSSAKLECQIILYRYFMRIRSNFCRKYTCGYSIDASVRRTSTCRNTAENAVHGERLSELRQESVGWAASILPHSLSGHLKRLIVAVARAMAAAAFYGCRAPSGNVRHTRRRRDSVRATKMTGAEPRQKRAFARMEQGRGVHNCMAARQYCT